MSDWLSILPGPAQTILYFFLALFPLVLIHEFGHFAVAKLNKIRVDEFGIGFPPRLITLFKHGDTEYTINSLPLGGFVRMAGEDDPTIPGAFASRSKRARAAVLFAGPLANFIQNNPTLVMLALGFLLLIGTTLVADAFGVHVPKGYIYSAMAFSVMSVASGRRASRLPMQPRNCPF